MIIEMGGLEQTDTEFGCMQVTPGWGCGEADCLRGRTAVMDSACIDRNTRNCAPHMTVNHSQKGQCHLASCENAADLRRHVSACRKQDEVQVMPGWGCGEADCWRGGAAVMEIAGTGCCGAGAPCTSSASQDRHGGCQWSGCKCQSRGNASQDVIQTTQQLYKRG